MENPEELDYNRKLNELKELKYYLKSLYFSFEFVVRKYKHMSTLDREEFDRFMTKLDRDIKRLEEWKLVEEILLLDPPNKK